MVDTSWHKTILKHRLLRPLIEIWLFVNRRFTSKYCMCLPRPSLSIRHDHSIEPIKDVLHNRFSYLFIRISLVGLTAEHTVKEEVSRVILLALQRNLLPRNIINHEAICLAIQIWLCPVDWRHRLAFLWLVTCHFGILRKEWPGSDHYPEISLLLRLLGYIIVILVLHIDKIRLRMRWIIQMVEIIHFY